METVSLDYHRHRGVWKGPEEQRNPSGWLRTEEGSQLRQKWGSRERGGRTDTEGRDGHGCSGKVGRVDPD